MDLAPLRKPSPQRVVQLRNGSVTGASTLTGKSENAVTAPQVSRAHRKGASQESVSGTQSGVAWHPRSLPLRPPTQALPPPFRGLLMVKLEGGQQRVNDSLLHKKDSFTRLTPLESQLNRPIHLQFLSHISSTKENGNTSLPPQ